MGRYFGTDGIRGVANVAPMDSDTVLRLGRAAAFILRRSKGSHRILIGKDTRLSGYMLESALCSGITSMGVDVLLVGPLPTPGIAFMARSMRADAGVVISASHNGYQDNGIKFFGPDGFKLPDETEGEIEGLLEPGHLDELRASPDRIGKAQRVDDAVGRYLVYLKSCLHKKTKFDGLKIVVDCANGAAYRVAPMLFSELGAEVFPTGVEPDGHNINSKCGSLYPEKLSRYVLEQGADIGIAFDGDADRVILCDEQGNVVDGDQILAILGMHFQENGKLLGGGVVGTTMSNFGLEKAFEERGIRFVRAAVGDRYVLAEMQSRGLVLGGEQSGHVISLEHGTTGDGILTALLITEILVKEQRRLSSYRDIFTSYPQILLNVPVSEKVPFDSVPAIAEKMRSTEKKLNGIGRLVLRYSGTELKARVMVECEDEGLCKSSASELADVIATELSLRTSAPELASEA